MFKYIFSKIGNFIRGPQNQPSDIAIGYHRKQSLEARVIRACTNCGAPGVTQTGQSVGAVCPECNAARPQDEEKGTIWEKAYT